LIKLIVLVKLLDILQEIQIKHVPSLDEFKQVVITYMELQHEIDHKIWRETKFNKDWLKVDMGDMRKWIEVLPILLRVQYYNELKAFIKENPIG